MSQLSFSKSSRLNAAPDSCGSAGLSHKAAGWQASFCPNRDLSHGFHSCCRTSIYKYVISTGSIKIKIRAYTLNPTQVKFGTRKMLTFGNQRVILTLLCKSILSHRGIFLVKTYALVVIFSNTENELCRCKRSSVFLCAASAAHFLF